MTCIDYYSLLCEKHPDNSDYLVSLGIATLNINDLEKAETALKQAITIKPSAQRAYSSFGHNAYKRNNHAEALTTSLKAIELKANEKTACMIWASTLAKFER